ncbi:MAG: baseplate J/gp47 family protein [Cyanobacteria bacterium P01_D01_bin.36]
MSERPSFIERSPAIIEPQVTAAFESALGKQLFPGQLERLLLNIATYRELVVRIGIQYAAEQNLVNYAAGDKLDQLGALLAVDRLGASNATVTLRFSRETIVGGLTIFRGSLVRPPGSTVQFATDEAVIIRGGSTTVDVTATAVEPGEDANGFEPGSITQLVNVSSGVTGVTNLDTSTGGATTEPDEAFRTRIKLAPTQFSVAGSKGAYRFYTLSADPSITDVAVLGPEDRGGVNPVTVDVYPLTSEGLPGQTLLDQVAGALNSDTIRPLTDIVNVATPTEINYDITASVVLFINTDQATAETALNEAVAGYVARQSETLGNDIIRSQIIKVLQAVSGVYSVSLTAPAQDIVVAPNNWANGNTPTITVAGANAG